MGDTKNIQKIYKKYTKKIQKRYAILYNSRTKIIHKSWKNYHENNII